MIQLDALPLCFSLFGTGSAPKTAYWRGGIGGIQGKRKRLGTCENTRKTKKEKQDQYLWNEWQRNQISCGIMNEDEDMEAAEKVLG